jgi:hypothetical protein
VNPCRSSLEVVETSGKIFAVKLRNIGSGKRKFHGNKKYERDLKQDKMEERI